MNRPLDDLLRRVRPAGPPSDLRDRSLAAAREARHRAVRPDVWTRVWSNRPLRIAWAASLAAVLVAHAALTVRDTSNPVPETAAQRGAYLVASTVPDDELRALVDLPSIATDTLPTFDPPTLDPHG
jgi:hypothetical protein